MITHSPESPNGSESDVSDAQTGNALPIPIPSPGSPIALGDVIAIEASIAHDIAAMDDIAALEEMHAKAEALARYLQGKELHGPMLGAQRRIEARIGQLLGDAAEAQRSGRPCEYGNNLNNRQRVEFRVLSRGMGIVTDEEWRQSRAALLKLINERAPMPRKTPVIVVTAEGRVSKRRDERSKEIAELAADGNRAQQIAEVLGIGEHQVRKIARDTGITLTDVVLGKTRRIDVHRVIESTVHGLEGYALGLQTINGALKLIDPSTAAQWAASLKASLVAIHKLQKQLKEVANVHERETRITGGRDSVCPAWGNADSAACTEAAEATESRCDPGQLRP